MFDDVKCLAPLPDNRVAAGSWFQTKDLACFMYKYTITAEGRLVFNKEYYKEDGEWEPVAGWGMPKLKLVRVRNIRVEYHGDFRMCAVTPKKALAEYMVRFTHGTLEWIQPYRRNGKLRKTWQYTRE